MATSYQKPYYANTPGDVEYYDDNHYPEQIENPDQPSGSQARHRKKKKHRSGDPEEGEAPERRRSSRRHRKSRDEDGTGEPPADAGDDASRERKKKKKHRRRPKEDGEEPPQELSPPVIGDVVATEYTFDEDPDYGSPVHDTRPAGHLDDYHDDDDDVNPTYDRLDRGDEQWHDENYPESPDHHIPDHEEPYNQDNLAPPEDPGKKKKNASSGGFSKLFASFRSKKKKPAESSPTGRQENWESNPQLFMPNMDGGTLEPGHQPPPPPAQDNRPRPRKTGKAGPSSEATVVLLDGDRLAFNIDKKATGALLLQKVCTDLNIFETDYFGLTWTSNKVQTWFWLDSEKKIVKQLKHNEPWLFHFQVKFYPPEPSLIQEDITRYQLCLQLRHDVYTGKLPCSWVTHALLGSYMVQSELGDYLPDAFDNEGLNYIREFEFFRIQNDELLVKIVELHKTHVGMTPDQADLKYLETAKRLEHYGVDLHPAWDSDNVQIFVGISFYGVFVYKDRLRLSRFAWPKILRISYKKNFFYLKIRSDVHDNVEGMIGFRLQTHHLAKRLWKNAIEHHTFFRLKETKFAAKTGTKIFPGVTIGSKYRFSGRTFFQHRTLSIDRPHPQFDRTLTKRRTTSMPSGLNQGGFQYGSLHSLHRNHPRDMTIGKTQSVEYLGPRNYAGSSSAAPASDAPRGGLYTRTNQEPFSSPLPPRNAPGNYRGTGREGSVSGSIISGDSQPYSRPQYQPNSSSGVMSPPSRATPSGRPTRPNEGVLSPQAASQRSGGSSRPRPNNNFPKPAGNNYYNDEDATYANMPAPPEDLRYQDEYDDEML